MPFLSPNKHTDAFPLKEISQEQFLVVAYEAAKQLPKYSWLRHISENGLIIVLNNWYKTDRFEITVFIKDGVATFSGKTINGDMTTWGQCKKRVRQWIAAIAQTKATLTTEQLAEGHTKLLPILVPKEKDILILPPKTFEEKMREWFLPFIITKDYFVTPILIYLHIFIFIILACNGGGVVESNDEVLSNWANYRTYTFGGDWWRLFTCIFVHFGIRHLLMNMLSLFIIGFMLEPYLGRVRFVAAYFSSGIIASLAAIIWNHYTISGGASGAIFGLFGVALVLMNANLMGESKSVRWTLIACVFGYIVLELVISADAGVDSAAHIGGVIGGIVAGLVLYPSFKHPDVKLLQWKCIGVLCIVVLALSFTVCKTLRNDYAIYPTGAGMSGSSS